MKKNKKRKSIYTTFRFLGYPSDISRMARDWEPKTIRNYIKNVNPKMPSLYQKINILGGIKNERKKI